MDPNASSGWTWNEEYQDYYMLSVDAHGQQIYIWAKSLLIGQSQEPHAVQSQPVQPNGTQSAAPGHSRVDSRYSNQQTTAGADEATPAPSVPLEIRQHEVESKRDFIAGTPQEGWYDRLDPSYRMRTGTEARGFFKLGRVFAMLYTEPAGEGARRGNNDAFSTVKYGEEVFSQIRRFVVVSVRRNFVHACAISTYRKQGTLKWGCDPGEHAVVYNTGIDPESCYLAGEKERGLYKEPIEVYPADSGSYLTPESRIRFGHVYSIEWNVKVKDIGRVVAPALSTLVMHYDEENGKFETTASHY